MKRYALLATGPKKYALPALYGSLMESGCRVGDSLLISFGSDFAAAIEVLGADRKSVSGAVKRLKGTLVTRLSVLEKTESPPFSNIIITMHGPNRPEALYRLTELLEAAKAEITGMETKAAGEGGLLAIAVEAYCPTRTGQRTLKGRIGALARSLRIIATVRTIKPEDLI